MCIYLQDMKLLWSKLLLGQLYIDNTNDDDNNANDDDDDNDNNNDTRQTNHDCTGSLTCMPSEPKTRILYQKYYHL